MDCCTPKRDDENAIENEACFKKLNKLVSISSPKAPGIKDFAIIKPISRGAFGKVFLGYKITDATNLFGIKVMRKSEMINKNMVSQVITERNALALSRSPFCVNLFYSLQTASYIYLVMEYMVGGDLKSLLAVSGYFDEAAAKFYCAEITLALQYLHEHGIVHRDIKPDNMLVATSGHIKLTDFGLSKIELSRDLEVSDLVNGSPSINTRTPGQLLSLTSHLSFGSMEKRGTSQITSSLMHAMNRQKSPEMELDTSKSHNDSHVSGVSPFQSAEDIQVVIQATSINGNAIEKSKILAANDEKENNSHAFSQQDDSVSRYSFDSSTKSNPNHKEANEEDSGISSRKSELSANINCELSGIEKAENSSNGNSKMDYSSLDFSKGAAKRKRCPSRDGYFQDRSSASTGLTQEIDIMDIGSSTPKKRKSKSPLKGVLKVRNLSDDEMPVNEHLNLGTVMFSTPVSSQKQPRGGLLKLKSTRFALPTSSEVTSSRNKNNSGNRCLPRYMKMAEPAMSPINAGNVEVTPKTLQTPYRTPKSVRRVEVNQNRILGTPDYLSPELLLGHGHGPEVDWWALGVCLYEFMTGVPPFNDETPHKVFDNILNRNIEWPQDEEALSDDAVTAVQELLTMSPEERPTAKDVQKMPFFGDIDWNAMENALPPFIPNPNNPTDTGYFEARNVLQHLKLSSFDLED